MVHCAKKFPPQSCSIEKMKEIEINTLLETASSGFVKKENSLLFCLLCLNEEGREVSTKQLENFFF